ncbi:hypothetical protein AB0G04_43750 [Actinoplanes sp. NPDC023801]|uniref:hypothetical protein n=1 Tax=Actinoplanes sp. NPDC023801 TaxID=3154595 RepID=UPI003400E39F
MKRSIRSVGAAFAALALTAMGLIVTGTPASAANWSTYTKTSKWTCAASATPLTGVTFESCLIISDRTTQAAVIMTNKSGGSIQIMGYPEHYVAGVQIDGGECPKSTLSNGYSRACLSPSRTNASCGLAAQGNSHGWVIRGEAEFQVHKLTDTKTTCSS